MSNLSTLEEQHIHELALSIAWHAGMMRTVQTITGEDISVVFPGHWTHGHGPDFRGAMLEFAGGRLVTGSVELHHRASDWSQHGHHTDPAYNDVVLHIVSDADTQETRRLDGALLPIAILRVPRARLEAVQLRNPEVWAQFGGTVCAPLLAATQPDRIRMILWHLGDDRFSQRVTRFESELASDPPAQVLVTALFDAFGYSRNREQMRSLSEHLRWTAYAHRLERKSRSDRVHLVLATMLGLAGWMPLSPAHASVAGFDPELVEHLEDLWRREVNSNDDPLPATIWDTARIRPANHPVGRVATLAALLGSHGATLVPVLLDAIRDELPVLTVVQELAQWHQAPPLGRDRTIGIAASVVLPFATAYAHATGDDILEGSAIKAWAELPAGTVAQPARRARQQIGGKADLRGLKERGNQGLLLLDRSFCEPRRCFECPVAHAVVADDRSRQSSSVYTEPPSA
jgi:hypothetical protein